MRNRLVKPQVVVAWGLLLLMAGICAACSERQPWNDPHVETGAPANTFYDTFSARPKTLDPARAYSSDEYQFIAQIYEPPLQYHYLKQPYQLVPLTAQKLPVVTYLDEAKHPLPASHADRAAYTAYTITIKPGIYYQPHPALATKPNGAFYYHNLTRDKIQQFHQLSDFKHQGTRELTADDYVYEIKRLANPQVASPIFGVMAQYIVGFSDFAKKVAQIQAEAKPQFLDLRQYELEGVKAPDFQIF